MSSTYKPDEEEYRDGRAKRGKAGSLSLSIPGSTRRGAPHASTPQAIVKVAGWANTPSSVKRMLDYVSRVDDKKGRELVDIEAEDGSQRKGQAEVEEVFNEWKSDFDRKSRASTSQVRHAVHLVLSAKAELTDENVGKTLAAARRVVEKHFGEAGYEYALAVHRDGKSPHVHAVVKTASKQKEVRKLRLGPKQLLEVRKSLAKELTKEGLEHVASRQPKKAKIRPPQLKGSAPDTLRKVEAVIKNLTKEQRQFERAMSRKEPKIHAIKFKQQQSKTLSTLRDQVKTDTKLTEEKRLTAFNLVRRFKREVEKKVVSPDLAVKATVAHFESRMAKWQKQLEKEQAESPNSKPVFSQETIKMGESITRDLQHFKRDLKEQRIPVEAKKEAFRCLSIPARDLMKIQERGAERGR